MVKISLLLLGGMLVACGSRQEKHVAEAATVVHAAAGVGCIGRILPENGSFFVSPYTAGGRAPVVDQLKIAQGDDVVAGQVIATLASRPYLESEVKEAETRVALARQRLARVNTSVPAEETAVIDAEIARLQVQRDAAEKDYSRNKPLFDQGFVSKAQLDILETRVKEADAAIAQARSRLVAMKRGRPEDAGIAEAEVRLAEAEVARTRQELNSSIVRAPSSAHVLRIIAHPGEAVGPQGIAELAQTSRMEVVAEVYEADIARVHNNETAVITSELLPAPVKGNVYFISRQIDRQDPISIEPGAPADARVFKVRLRVDDQSVLAGRINGKVNVVLQP